MLSTLCILVIAACAATGVSASIWPHSASQHLEIRAADNGYTQIIDKRIPDKQLRVRQIHTCESDQVLELSGYIDIQKNANTTYHLYFHSYGSRDPSSKQTQLWLNGEFDRCGQLTRLGGPGCSSLIGMLTELGPCRLDRKSKNDSIELVYNEYGWNSNVTMLFLDQPVGVGFSCAVGVYTAEAAAADVHHFLQLWLEAFKDKYPTELFHISGESYAGRYIPVTAAYIVEQNLRILNSSSGERIIPLDSVMIGDGVTDEKRLMLSYYPTVCTNETGVGPFVNETYCAVMKRNQPRCEVLFDYCNSELDDNNAICSVASSCAGDTQQTPFYDTGRNAYNVFKFGDYDEDAWIEEYLSRNETLKLYGILDEQHFDHNAPQNFTECSNPVGNNFYSTGDGGKDSTRQIVYLLDHGVRVLIYAGDYDYICNWSGNNAWTLALEWTGHDGFNAEPLRPWYVPGNGTTAGRFRTYGNLTFTTIHAAGHYVPRDQPISALALERAWVQGGPNGLKALA